VRLVSARHAKPVQVIEVVPGALAHIHTWLLHNKLDAVHDLRVSMPRELSV
jgi:hypothetical protein